MRRLLLLLLLATPLRALDLSGFVYDGVPKAGVAVTASVNGAQVARTVTGENGSFAFQGLPDGVVELSAAQTSMLVFSSDIVSIDIKQPAPEEGRHALAARRGEGAIHGVITLNGKPLANAPVVVQELAAEDVSPIRVYANAKGEFAAKGLAAGRYVITPDERLKARVPAMNQMYVGGREPFIVDLTKTREAAANLELLAAPVVRGRVVDAEGKPVAHARVQLVIASRPVLDFARDAFVRTTPEGRFALAMPDWEASESANLAVTAPLHSTVRSKSFPAGTSDRIVDITLPAFDSVRVRVADRAGKPVAGARIAFAPREENDNPDLLAMLARTGPATNEAGELALQLARDTYDFAVDAEGFQSGIATKAVTKPANVDVVLERAAIVRGRVHRNGRGVAGVNVSVVGGTRRRADTSTTTDDQGAFTLNGLAPGKYRLMFFHADQLLERNLEIDAPGEVDLALPPSGTLRARVIDAATGAPVREFTFLVHPGEGRGRVARGERSEDGTFSVTVPVGTYRVSAGAEGYTSAEPVEVRVTEREPASIELRLGRGVTINGRVADEAGAPIAGADIMVIARSMERMMSRSSVRVAPGHATSSVDGSFTITGVDPGEASMTVRKEGFSLFRKAIDADGAMTIDVRLTRGLSLSGIVTRGGKGVGGVQIYATSAAVGGDQQRAVSAEDGRFTITGLVAARYSVNANAPDGAGAEVHDVDPSKAKEIAISLDPKPRGVVYGVVTGIPPSLGGGGKYVRRVVMVQAAESSAEGMIDEAGNYRLEDAPLGEVYVIAQVQAAPDTIRSSVRKKAEVVAGQPLRVDLEVSGGVSVTGRITHEGKGLGGAHIGFSSDNGVMAAAITRDDGSYDLSLPAAGRYNIYARAEQLSDRHFSTVRDVRGGERIDVDLREQILEGTVLDAVTRQPIANALVILGPALAATYAAAEVQTDGQGRFRITTASAGAHRLTASAAGHAHQVMPVNGTTTNYLFELAPAAELRVRVVDARSGTPLDAHVVVHESGGTFVPVRNDRSTDGTMSRFALAPGKYRLTVVVRGYTTKVVDATAPGVIDVMME
jgi:protocatechuate 3,4-dioxygenase beta subunit